MKQHISFWSILIVLSCLNLKAQDISVDMGTASNYLAHGRTLSNDLPCFQPSVTYSLKSGTSIYAWFSLPYDRTTSFNDEYNIIVDQSLNLFSKHPKWTFNLHGYADYWLNPRTSNPTVEPSIYHGMKYNTGINKSFFLHREAGINMVTGYDFYYYQIFGSGRDLLSNGGIHEFLIRFNKPFKKLDVSTKSLISNNRGAVSSRINPGWSYFTQQLSFAIKTGKLSLRTSVNYQWTLDETIHSDNLLWFTLNVSRGFKI